MPLEFVPFTEPYVDAVRAFNQRMRDASAPSDFLLPEEVARRVPASDARIRWTQYIVLDGEEVRGGLIEMDQPGWLAGGRVGAINYQSHLSEGIVNGKHAMVGVLMVKFMERRGSAVFIVGMGSASNRLPRLLKAAGWSVRTVPFLFRVHRAGPFLREVRILHATPARSIAARAAARTGIGSLGLRLLQLRWPRGNASIRQVKGWGDWADEIWQQFRLHCSFAVSRDRRTVEDLYPPADPRLRILLVEQSGHPVGWAVCFDTLGNEHRRLGAYFGNLRVASILDCVAAPDAMRTTALLTDHEMASRGADLVLSNQSHARWVRAFRSAGFLRGPSNWLLAMSQTLTEAIRRQRDGEDRIHITRGDGDGRIGLG